ncbi:hypothetical protein K7X08_023390 [Anisodus acutangulus]|uniref:Uncharacterized protein n=1 Tax=Anisodus acutangulus TaxID=402998 RepID=A0A9Q1LHW0_9SOLA|nr:hypothetical protein K7X08_023390 [Anisodus acutangulus]
MSGIYHSNNARVQPLFKILTCKIPKKMGGCDYFFWIEDRHPAQANRVIWGLLKKVKAFEVKRIRARNVHCCWFGHVLDMKIQAKLLDATV